MPQISNKSTGYSVGTTPMLIAVADKNRTLLEIQNRASNSASIFIGGSSMVTTSNGLELVVGDVRQYYTGSDGGGDHSCRNEFWAVAASSQDVRVFEGRSMGGG
jgi:hypothetical protein